MVAEAEAAAAASEPCNKYYFVPYTMFQRVTNNRFLHFGKYTYKQLFSNIHKFLEIKPKELALYYEK